MTGVLKLHVHVCLRSFVHSLLLSNFSILISLCTKELPVICIFLSMQIYNVLLYYIVSIFA